MKRADRYSILLVVILLIGLSLRIWGLTYDLPYIYHPDEPYFMNLIQNIFKTSNLNPQFYNYPSLFFYLNAIAYVPYYLIGKLLGIFSARIDILAPVSLVMGVTRTQMPGTVILGRSISLIFGVGIVAVTYLAGRKIANKASVGLLASLMVAVVQPNVSLSRFIAPDIFVSFFAIASFLASVLVYQQGKIRYYIIAGLCAGLAASTKYNGGLIVLPLILAHFLRYGRHGLINRNLYIAVLVVGLGFLAGTPLFITNFPQYLEGIKYESLHYSIGHMGMEGDALKWYLGYMWSTGGIIYILSILGLIYGLYTRSKEIILLSVFPVVYFIFISSYTVRNDRTFLILAPFLFLLAASFLEFLASLASKPHSLTGRTMSRMGLACLGIIAIGWSAAGTIEKTIRMTAVDGRETSRVWIDSNLPAGAKIALESYSPFINPERFSVEGIVRMIDHPPEWYIANGFDYLVFSQGMYGRFFNEPDRYSSEIAQYNEFFNRFALVKTFNDNNYEIRIYKLASEPHAN